MPPPQPILQQAAAADVLIVESTYGNRLHPPEDGPAVLAQIIGRTVQRGGSVLMPAFAVGRAQALLLGLQRLKRAGLIPAELPIFVDSPMALQATALYRQHAALLRVPAREMKGLVDGVRLVATVQESMRLSGAQMLSKYPCVVISASGMATGGRVLHHLKAMAPHARNTVVLAGFQAGGTRGARLVAGERSLRIFGEDVPVRAEVQQLEGFSGHADQAELLAWLGQVRQPPRQTFVVHGEPDAADSLRVLVQQRLGWRVRVPQHGEVVEIT
jgi:metallo-beta-lactamase family protein